MVQGLNQHKPITEFYFLPVQSFKRFRRKKGAKVKTAKATAVQYIFFDLLMFVKKDSGIDVMWCVMNQLSNKEEFGQ